MLEPGAAREPRRRDRASCSPRQTRSSRDEQGDRAAARSAARDALDLLQTTRLPERLLELADDAARGPRAAAFNDARKAVRALALEELASRDRELLQELLTGFADAYAEAKDRESALDFEDLQLRAARAAARATTRSARSEQLRFRSIMVDEFQDTNRLQTELVDLLCAGPAKELFFVGDEFQSIYGFRHADVAGVPRPPRGGAAGAAADPQLPLAAGGARGRQRAVRATSSARASSRSTPAGGYGDPVFGTPFELLVTDKASYADSGVHWRRAEARHVARRVRELVDAGAATPGEIVLLFAAGTDAEWFEEELRAVDLPTIRMTGRRYFGQQQVVDLLSYLRLLQNRYDDEALLTVLASPFVGVSNDALVLIRANAEKRPIFKGIERTLPADLAEDDRRLVRAFLQRYERLVESSTRLSLELLCERILVEHDYDLAVLTRRDGQRRYANLRKLARLARSYEELRGPDIEGFIRFVAEQDAVGAPERDAVSEEEGADAVRLLTIHAAKGLEFKVVVVADAGRERSRTDEILCLSDGRFGFKVAHPGTGIARQHDLVPGRQGDAGSGRGRRAAAPLLRRDDPGDGPADRVGLGRPLERARRADADRLGARAARARGGARSRRRRSGPVEVERGNAAVVLRIDRFDPASAEQVGAGRGAGAEPTRRASSSSSRARGRRSRRPRHACASSSRSRRHRSRACRGSPTAPSRCSTAAGTATTPSASSACSPRPWEPRMGADGAWRPPSDGDRRRRPPAARARRPGEPGRPGRGRARAARRAAGIRRSRRTELARIGELVRSYTGSALAARIAGLRGVRPERPFAFELDGVLVNGRLDVLWLEGERALVLDYKTNALLGRDPAEIVEEEYLTQQIVYAIACLRAGAHGGRGRLPLPRGSGRGRLDGVHGRRCSAAREACSAPRSRASGRASSGRRRARSPARAARRSNVVCAGPRLGGLRRVGVRLQPHPLCRRTPEHPRVRE